MLSIIIPFLNEEKNLTLLYKELKEVLATQKLEHEIIYVDDGSTDASAKEVELLQKHDKSVVLLSHRKAFGKGKAIRTGLSRATGGYIVFMDADLQDDPHDLPVFLEKLKEGYDLVNGIRVTRKDNPVVKLYSKSVNILLRSTLKSPFTDINCGFKMFRRQVLDEIVLYGNNFRFLPLAAFYKGFKVGEVPVNNRSREHGKSKYGIKKLFIGMIDTLTAYFLYQFAERPLHFFGTIGGIFFGIGFLYTCYLVFERIFYNVLLYRRPALLLGILFIIVGIQIAMTGIVGELIVYINRRNTKT